MAEKFSTSDIDGKWIGISIIIFFISQIVISVVFTGFGIMTLGIGFLLFIIIKPVTYFVGGYICAFLSPGRTIAEPAIGASIIAIIGGFVDSFRSEDVGLFGIIFSSVLALIFALIGAYLAEKEKNN